MAIDSQPAPGAIEPVYDKVVVEPDAVLRSDPRRAEVENEYKKICQSVLIWEVVGGGKDGGIMVREGQSLKSLELLPRLRTGSLVRELAAKGERLRYQLLQGSGPSTGWVSIKVKHTEMLASVSKKPELMPQVQLLIRRLSMLPKPLQKVLFFPVPSCQQITEQIYQPRVGCLDRSAKDKDGRWLPEATLKRPLDPSIYSAFPPNDAALWSLLGDEKFAPVQRCFPREVDGKIVYCRSADPVAGLLPDTVAVLYFLEIPETLGAMSSLRGVVRFGAQATQSMSRGEPEEDGEFAPGVHGGAEAMVLADAAVYLARLTWNSNAMLKKISCQFSKPCPCFETLEISVSVGLENTGAYGFEEMVAKVSLKLDKTLISFGEATLISFPAKPLRLPEGLPTRCFLPPPGVDWVPPELAMSRLPPPNPKRLPYDQEGYMNAALKEPGMRFPASCAAVEEVGREDQQRQRGRQKHLRANRPVRGSGDMRNDLCFPGGLTPAAVSFEKYFAKDAGGILFEGILKLGPQATEALFLTPDGKKPLDGSMSLVAHPGMALAALDDHLAHLPRCDAREKTSITWKLDVETQAFLPIGQELDFECYCPFQQDGPVGNRVTGEIRFENQILATLSAVITSSDAKG